MAITDDKFPTEKLIMLLIIITWKLKRFFKLPQFVEENQM